MASTKEKVSKVLKNGHVGGDNHTQKWWMATHIGRPTQVTTKKKQAASRFPSNKHTQSTKMATKVLPKCYRNGNV